MQLPLTIAYKKHSKLGVEGGGLGFNRHKLTFIIAYKKHSKLWVREAVVYNMGPNLSLDLNKLYALPVNPNENCFFYFKSFLITHEKYKFVSSGS